MVLHLFVCNPDRAQASGLGSHDVDTVTEVDRQLFNARTCELEHLVLHSAALECSLNERDSHVVRTYALLGLALEPYEHHFRCVDVPCVLEQLLHELAAAFANAHVTERAVACVRVGTENHVAALHHHLASILVDDSLVSRNVDAAVLLSCRQTEYVVVLIDSAAYCAERVVAVCHSVRQRELLQTACACCLNDSNICNIVRHHCVEADAHLLSLRAVHVVRAEDAVGDSVLASFVGCHAFVLVANFGTVEEIDSVINKFYHNAKVLSY